MPSSFSESATPDPEHLISEGLRLAAAGHPAEALAAYDRALAAVPDDPAALYGRGDALWDLDRPEEALESFRDVLRQRPDFSDALYNVATLLHQLGRYAEAATAWQALLPQTPNDPDAFLGFGHACFRLGRFDAAAAGYGRAAALRPGDPDAWVNRATALRLLGQTAEALASCERALALRANHPDALASRAGILLDLDRLEEALAGSEQALAVAPNHVVALNNRGTALFRLQEPDRALASFEQALAGAPENLEALCNRGVALRELRRLPEALAAFERAVAAVPGNPKALYNRGMTFLQMGRLPEGWRDCENRWAAGKFARPDLPAGLPEWTGQPLEGRSILVYREQGVGDVIQFARYLPLLAARGAEVAFWTEPATRRLLESLPATGGAIRIITEPPEAARFDFQCALMSLPLGFATTLETIPAAVPYLAAEADRVAGWRARIGTEGRKIGLCWQGNPAHRNDRNRSLPLEKLRALAEIPGVRLFSLQKEHGLGQLAGEDWVTPLGESFADFADTAAVIACLDGVVSVDTAIAHLAGALGRPVSLALPHAAEWRWLEGRTDSPWYPTMRLYRQESRGDWEGVVRRIAADLAAEG